MALKFFGKGRDRITGTSGIDLYVATRKSSPYTDSDYIIRFQSMDAIDLPGKWGKNGFVTLKGRLFNAHFDDNLSRLIAKNIKVGYAGTFGLSGGGWGQSTVLFYNLGGRGLDNKDVFIGLYDYKGDVTIV